MKTKKNNPGYEINNPNCGRDKNGVFHCRCGKCKKLSSESNDRDKPMEYKYQKIVNLRDLEKLIQDAHLSASLLKKEIKKETPDPAKVECFLKELNREITAAKDFEFYVEIRKVYDRTIANRKTIENRKRLKVVLARGRKTTGNKYEKIVNLCDFEALIAEAYEIVKELESITKEETPEPGIVECFIGILNDFLKLAEDFEFKIEIRNVTE